MPHTNCFSILRLLSLLALAIAVAMHGTSSTAWGIGCEPGEAQDLKSIEELVGPIDERAKKLTEAEQKAKQEQRVAEQRAKEIRDMQKAEIDRITAKLQTSLDDPNLWLSRARIRTELGEREGAITDLTQYMKLQGQSAEILAERGKLQLSLNHFDKAEADLNEAVKLEPENPDVLFARGKIFIEQWKTAEAYGDFSKAIEIDPNHLDARYNRAYLLLGVRFTYGNCRAAVQDLKVVVEAKPDWLLARYHYVRALHGYGKSEEVIRHATYVIWHDPESECMYSYRSMAYKFTKQYEKAMLDATKYMEFNPRDAARVVRRAEIFIAMEDWEKALADLNTFLEARPENASGYRARADVHEELRNYEASIKDWDKMVELEPENSDWPRFRGMVKRDAGDHDGALADLNMAMSMSPLSGALRNNRSIIYKEMGEHAKAWADEASQTRAVKESIGKLHEYDELVAEEKQKLTALIEEQLAILREGKSLNHQIFWKHDQHPEWDTLWITALLSLLESEDKSMQENGLRGFEKFVMRVDAYPISQENTDRSIAALETFAAADHPEPLKKKATILAKNLGVLFEVNQPDYEGSQPESLHFKKLTLEADEQGRPCEFTRIGIEWLEKKERYTTNRFREIRHTPEFIELYSMDRHLWVRLHADKATWSWDRKNWKLIGHGEITKR